MAGMLGGGRGLMWGRGGSWTGLRMGTGLDGGLGGGTGCEPRLVVVGACDGQVWYTGGAGAVMVRFGRRGGAGAVMVTFGRRGGPELCSTLMLCVIW